MVLLLLITGLGLLIGGGALLVRGASAVATALGVAPVVVGLTIVGFGTSAPELTINALGVAQGKTDLAFGNVVGSNISNLGLVLGAAALISPLTIKGQLVRREIPLLLLATTAVIVLAHDDVFEHLAPALGRSDALVLLLFFIIFLYVNALDVLKPRPRDPIVKEFEQNPLVPVDDVSRYRWLFIVAGVVMLALGAELTLSSATDLAEWAGVSDTIIGLFVVAVGTSLPELVTSIVAALRQESDLALGNVVGSNLFNSLAVLPVGALVAPIPVPSGGTLDLWVSWILVALLIPAFFVGQARLNRWAGFALLAGYFSYLTVRVTGF